MDHCYEIDIFGMMREKVPPSIETTDTSQRSAISQIYTENSELQPYSLDQRPQEKIDAMTVYTQSLILDQRGNSRQTKFDSDNQVASKNRQDVSSTTFNWNLPVSPGSLSQATNTSHSKICSSPTDEDIVDMSCSV